MKIWQNKLPLLLLLGLALRLYALFQPAHTYDIATYQAWGELLLSKGPAEFYASTWSDYLPFPTYLFGLTAWLSQHLELSFSLVFKSFFTLLELGLLLWILKLLSTSKSLSPYLLCLYFLLSPALIGDTSWWGQTDSFPALLAILSLLTLRRYLPCPRIRTLLLASTLFSLAISFKPIVLLTLPVFLILYLTHPSRPPLSRVIPFVLFSILLFASLALPVAGSLTGAFSFLLAKANEQANTYPFLSVNAYNLWTLHSSFTSWLPDNQVVLGLSAHSFGQLLFALLSLRLLFLWYRAKWAAKHAFRIGATLLITFYVVTTRMHERHLLFGLLFLCFAVLEQSWLLFPTLLLTFTFTVNLYAAYYWMIHAGSWPFDLSYAHLLSWLNLLLALALNLVWDWPRTLSRLKSWLGRHRTLFLILLLASGLRLVALHHPPAHIFDEVYHAFTAEELVKNNPAAWEWWNTPPEGFAYEWTHPPVAKYGMVAGLLLFGDSPFGWRFFSAVFGVLSLIGFYRLSHLLFGSKQIALTTTYLLTLSGLHLVQSRIGMNDIYLLTFLVWSLVTALKRRWKSAGILYGLALASKWSALYGLLPLSLIFLHQFWPHLKTSLSALLYHLLLAVRLLAVAAITYLLSYTPFFLAAHSWEQFLELHRQMWYYHTHLVATHAYQSTPAQWILSLRPVWYYVEYAKQPSYLYVQGNPLLLWFGLVAVLSALPLLKSFRYLLTLSAYFAFIVPWLFSPRIMFFYHYLPSAAFLTLLLGAWLHTLSSRLRLLIVFGITLSFILLTPVYYGFPAKEAYWQTFFSLFPSWK